MTSKFSAITLAALCLSSSLIAQDYKSGIEWQEPPIVTPGETNAQPPADATVLFDGTDMSAWTGGEWKVDDGVVYSGKGMVISKEKFGDIQLHIEWSAPSKVKGDGQGRGNSGVYLMGKYEIQILDSYDNLTYFDGQAASIYKQTPPLANAMRKPGEWNTYEIFWTAPRFAVNGDVESPAYVTVVHNGVLVQNHFELMGPSSFVEAPHYKVHDPTGPISLQDHGNPVRFRNIWVREIKPAVGQRTSAPYVMKDGKQVSVEAMQQEKETQKFQKAVENAVQQALKEADADAEAEADAAKKESPVPEEEPAAKEQ
jgi:hypothetical protein